MKKYDGRNLFSRSEAAEYLELAPNTIAYHTREGNLTPELVGGKFYVYTRRQLDHFQKNRRGRGRPASS